MNGDPSKQLDAGWVITSGRDDKYRPISDITWPEWEKYAARNGMSWMPGYWSETQFEHYRNPSWGKLWDIRRCLEHGFEYVMYVDADSVPLRDVPLDQACSLLGYPDVSVWLAYEQLADLSVWPSCGLMVIKNDEIGRQWIEELYKARFEFARHPWAEQAQAYKLLGFSHRHLSPGPERPKPVRTEWSRHVSWITGMGTPKSVDYEALRWVYHATGIPFLERIQLLQYAVDATPGLLVDNPGGNHG